MVDKIGTLQDAITKAEQLAKVENPSISRFPQVKSWMEDLNQEKTEEDYLERKMKVVLGEYYEPLKFIQNVDRGNYLQARTFFYPASDEAFVVAFRLAVRRSDAIAQHFVRQRLVDGTDLSHPDHLRGQPRRRGNGKNATR